MRPSSLLVLFATLALTAETAPIAPVTPAAPTTPVAPATTPSTAPQKTEVPSTTLTAGEQRQLRNARSKANKLPEVAAALKAEEDAYRLVREARAAKKPKAEVEALNVKARALRATREKMRDDAIIAANPLLKPLVEKAAQRAKSEAAAEPAKTETVPAPKDDESKMDG